MGSSKKIGRLKKMSSEKKNNECGLVSWELSQALEILKRAWEKGGGKRLMTREEIEAEKKPLYESI